MSSRSRIFSERPRLRAAALLLALVAALGQGAPAAAAVPLPVAAILTDDGQTFLVVDLSASTSPGPRTVSVTRAGMPERAALVPVMSDQLAVALVVDTSEAGASTLPAWLSAGARFILEAPSTTQSVVIADTAPAAAITQPQRGPIEIVRALNAVRAGGDRDTAAALTLATRQFPATPAGRRVVVLYTTASEAGGMSAATLSARFRATGTILVVVGTADAGRYWTEAAAGTGGFFAPVGNPVVVPALDQVKTTLSGRYLVQFPTPPALPARVSVRVDTGDLTLTGEAVITAPPPVATSSSGPGIRTLLLGGLAAGILALAAAALFLLLRRFRRAGRKAPDNRAGRKAPDKQITGQPPPTSQRAAPQKPAVARMPPAAPKPAFGGRPPAGKKAPRIAVQPPLIARGRAEVSRAEMSRSVARGRASVVPTSVTPEPQVPAEGRSSATPQSDVESGYSE